jgi:hypothetical protein
MVKKLRKASTNFMWDTFMDSNINLVENRTKQNLSCVPDSAETSNCINYISQTRTNNNVIPEAKERYRSLVDLI